MGEQDTEREQATRSHFQPITLWPNEKNLPRFGSLRKYAWRASRIVGSCLGVGWLRIVERFDSSCSASRKYSWQAEFAVGTQAQRRVRLQSGQS
jgi:hypothetical protein